MIDYILLYISGVLASFLILKIGARKNCLEKNNILVALIFSSFSYIFFIILYLVMINTCNSDSDYKWIEL